jgi:hypothetical protein
MYLFSSSGPLTVINLTHHQQQGVAPGQHRPGRQAVRWLQYSPGY